ncbi:MAG: DUF4129 domain-containing protein [Dehalococcoidia bacterium]|nr:DUF4129 domain-containing protein [Dehalococcoidia bacterium]
MAFWNASELADYFESASQGFQPIDVVAFTEDPNPGLADPRAAGFGLVVSTAVWIRFLAIGRSPVRWESALRSFSLGFPVVLAATFVGSMNRVPGGAAALAYFTLALLTLAIANAGRAVEQGTRSGVGSRAGLMKSPLAAIRSPWAFASAAAILILFATGATLVAFTSFGAGTAILLVGDLVARVVQSIALLVITPIYWLIQFAADWMNLRLMDLSFMTRALNEARPDVMPSTQHPDGRLFWVGDAFRLAGFALLAYLVYRGARYMFSKLESRRADNAEGDRSTVTSAGGFGALLREAFAGRPHRERDDGGWMRRQPAYWLYGRMVHGAVERRFAPRAGETPLEFAAASQLALDAPVFTSIAREFDRARYGAHYPSEDELRPLAAALRDWETAHPVTDEIRMKPGRDEEAPQIEIERTPDVPEPPPELMPPV